MKSIEENFQNHSSDTEPIELGFGNIAISLSGGGYRAAAFHLGSLDLLYRVGLLDRVTMLSTVSGGTITGAKYVLALSQQESNTNQTEFFQGFYEELYSFLLNQPLPDIWIEELDQQNNTSSQPPRLISAVAQTYRELFKNTNFKEIIQAKSKLHLQEIIFNTTELRTGLNFRFQIGSGKIGNGNIQIPESIFEEVYLADAVAASSCFPIGFEPMYFPDDFLSKDYWNNLVSKVDNQNTRNSLKKNFTNSLPLIDGGIYDNLGVDSIWLANERVKRQEDKIGTLIISDTDNLGLEKTLLQKPDSKLPLPTWITKITLKQVKNIVGVLSYFFIFITIIYIIYFTYLVFNTYLIFHNSSISSITLERIVNILLITLATGLFWGIKVVLKKVTRLFNNLEYPSDIFDGGVQENPEQERNLVTFLRNIISDWDNFMQTIGDFTLSEAYNLFTLRLQSIPAVLLAFLKGQRRRNYAASFDYFGNKIIPSYIFDANLESKNTSEAMAEIALKATKTPTTLWFDSNREIARNQLNDLIACGQFTLCYKLRKHIEKMEKKSNEDNISLSPQTVKVKQHVDRIWHELIKDPHSIVSQISETEEK